MNTNTVSLSPATTPQAPKPLEVVEVAGVTHVRSANGSLISIE